MDNKLNDRRDGGNGNIKAQEKQNKNIIEEAWGKWWDEKCKEFGELQQKGRYDKVYEQVKQLFRKPWKGEE